MRFLLWVLVTVAAAVGIVLFARDNPGHVLFVVPPYRVEMSIALFVVAAIGFFAAIYVAARIIVRTLQLPREVQAFRARRAREKARAKLDAALRFFFEGRYAKAEKAASDAFRRKEQPALSAVVAARSAQELRKFEDRDRYLTSAESGAPEEKVVRLMTQAELLYREQRPAEALAAMESLRQLEAKPHTGALRLELKIQERLGNWQQVLTLLEQLDKRHAFDAALVEQMRRRAQIEILRGLSFKKEELAAYWSKIPASERRDPKIAAVAARSFMEVGECVTAHGVIEQALAAHWQPELVALYGECLGEDALAQTQRAEKWLTEHDDDAGLLLTLGKLCAYQQLWGKAQSYLEASIVVAPSQEAHIALARLAERLGRADEARRHYRKGLELCGQGRDQEDPVFRSTAVVKASE